MQYAQRVQVLHACCNIHQAQHSRSLRMCQQGQRGLLPLRLVPDPPKEVAMKIGSCK